MQGTTITNPSRRKTTPPNVKKPVPDWHKLVRPPMSDANPRKSNLEKAMDEDLAELRICIDMFLNSRMNEAEALLRGRHKPESMYYQFGKALVDALRAILTFYPDDIEKAMKSFDLTLKVANAQRKTSSIIGMGTVKAFGSWVVGTIGASSFKGMTRIEKHAELVYAEAMVLRAGFSILYHQDFWSLLEETVSLRSAFAIFNGLKSHFDTVEQELKAGGDISEHHLDEHLVTGLIFAASLFNIAISFFPDVIIKLLQFVGMPSDRDWGLALLNTAGQWNPNAGPDSPIDFQQRLNSPTNDGMRRQICDMAPIAIHLIATSFLPFRHVDYSFAERINNYNLHKYPESMFFLFLKARHAQVNTRLDESIAIHEAITVQPEWRNLKHACAFEQLMCAMMESDYDLACTKSRLLLRESNWSKTIFRYLAAITTMRRGRRKEAERVVELMKKVELGMQKFCGVEVFPETFCARKANRYLNEGRRLLLPDYDFLVLWNGFEMMPMKSLRVALSNIMLEVQRLDALLPPSMLAISDSRLPKGGYTIEATKGIMGTFRSGVHSLTKADKVEGYDHFYDDYCIVHYLLGLVAKNIAFFPEEVFDSDMCVLAIKAFKTVFRYAPYIKDDTYAYYFSHYNIGLIMMKQGQLDRAEEKFKYLLSTINPTLMGLPALIAGKGRNSLEVLILAKAHAAMFLLSEDRAHAAADMSRPDITARQQISTSESSLPSSPEGLSAALGGLVVTRTTHSSVESTSSGRESTGSASSITKIVYGYRDFPVVDVSRQH
ncbi:hypothetical protein BC939DRAFT_477455 [Gamsiella multidivaricata]|uniref:uncharacterized protein n=1 Tax=Gamsiella multidivaricata TaxID=101098 RepID=UPI00221F6954|nr:uncharacterized protein BC939DRAFT_477455 [Gamsiella multidivaricata]KAG0363856.1 hypothetical protein BGZ54_007991 [Gamsiella multidivaricata]KAI7823027.1 hypothetical protein BC939DRAFT_477455 [Gamsiella multidivaricata]